MKEEDQRIAIAEACGWHIAERVHADAKPAACMCWVRPGGEEWHEERLPDYLNDLNACHEMEEVIMKRLDFWWAYQSNLKIIAKDLDRFGTGSEIHASASQRCEAFLKTIGKWTDDK